MTIRVKGKIGLSLMCDMNLINKIGKFSGLFTNIHSFWDTLYLSVDI